MASEEGPLLHAYPPRLNTGITPVCRTGTRSALYTVGATVEPPHGKSSLFQIRVARFDLEWASR